MRGIELAEAFYERYGRPMLQERFPAYEKRIAVGLVGPGSECFGYDDEVSRDHDFSPGFCLWLTAEDDAEIGFALMDAYAQLPKAFEGIALQKSSIGAVQKHGVFTIEEFYTERIGLGAEPQNWREWFYLPEHALATAVNGKVFRDDLGLFSAVRNALNAGYPKDIFLKKLAGHLALMAQSGQYNYSRCLQHGEEGAAKLALFEFVQHTIHAIFLLNNRYAPFYKWQFRALKEQPLLSELAFELERLLVQQDPGSARSAIEMICEKIVLELKRRSLTGSSERYLEGQALILMQQIKDPEIRSLHLMETGVS